MEQVAREQAREAAEARGGGQEDVDLRQRLLLAAQDT